MDDIAKIKLLQKRCEKWFERARTNRSNEKALRLMLAVRDEHIKSLTRRVGILIRTCDYWKGIVGRDKDQIASLTKRLHDKEVFIEKLNQAYISPRCFRDKNDSVAELQERVGMLVTNCDALTKAIKKVEEWRDYWKKGYFEVYTELQDLAKALCEANEKLNKLAEAEKPEQPNWRARYWEVVGKLAARRDECQDLKAKVKRLEEEAVVARGGFDYFVEEKKDLEGIVATLRELRDCDQKQAVAGTEDVEALKKELKDLGKYFKTTKEGRDYWFKEYQRVAHRNQVIETKLEAN